MRHSKSTVSWLCLIVVTATTFQTKNSVVVVVALSNRPDLFPKKTKETVWTPGRIDDRSRPDFPPEIYENLSPTPENKAVNAFFTVFFPETFFDNVRSSSLIQDRSYARSDAFEKDHLLDLPDLQDLSSPPTPLSDNYWFTVPFRLLVCLGAYYGFPFLTSFLVTYVPMVQGLVSISSSDLVPGISILYGTFVSLTLNILYDRKKVITQMASSEAATLLLLARRTSQLFAHDPDRRLSASYCIMDQVRILVREDRGRELMKLIYTDPYESLESIILDYKNEMMKQDATDLVRCTTSHEY